MAKGSPGLHPAEARTLDALAALPSSGRARLLADLARFCRKKDLTYGKKNQPLGLVPFVVPAYTLPALRGVARAVYRFQMRAPALYRENAFGFAGLIRLERRTKAWFERYGGRDPKPWQLLIRPDFGFQPDAAGRLKPLLYEFNSLMLGGLSIHSDILDIEQSLVLPALGLSPRALGLKPSPHLLGYLSRWLLDARRRAGRSTTGGVAFLESLPPGGGFSELPKIARYFTSQGVEALHGDPRSLTARGGGARLRGMEVSFVYRDFSFEDVSGPDNERMRAFGRLWEQGRVTPGFPSDFDQKGILECLTAEEFQSLFTRREARLLRAHVPWTRVMGARRTYSPEGRRVDLPEFARKNRDRLVLKPSWSSGGDGILLGPKVTQARWEKALEKALSLPGGAALQQYLDLPKKPVGYFRDGDILIKDCRGTLGVFYDGARLGFHARISPKDIVNVAQGGAMSPVYFG